MAENRGGKRTGTPGVAYGNRTDLNAAGPSAGYGQRVAQERAMQALPVAPPPAPPRPNAPASTRPGTPGPIDAPIDAPTARPDEPLTAGAPVGPGPGMEAIGMDLNPVATRLRAIYQILPNEDLRELLEDLEEGL